MDPLRLLEKHYPPGTPAHRVLLRHSLRVAELALAVAARLGPAADATFVREAALLHDIGILFTHAPELGCRGPLPYLCHGVKGRELLESEGFPRHALVCERHIGVGLTRGEVGAQGLPLPLREMLPVTLEEQIVTYADLFFSKSPGEKDRPRDIAAVRRTLGRYGPDKLFVFDAWHARFSS